MMQVIEPTNNIIINYTVKHFKSSWEEVLGQLGRIKNAIHTIYTATCADEGGTQGALFMSYTVD